MLSMLQPSLLDLWLQVIRTAVYHILEINLEGPGEDHFFAEKTEGTLSRRCCWTQGQKTMDHFVQHPTKVVGCGSKE